MALITLRGYFFDETGAGVGGIEVNAYAKKADGTWAATASASVTSASGSGMWEIINLDTALATETGIFSLRFRNVSTGQIRRQEGNQRAMFEQIIGPSGTAPLANQSVTSSLLLDNAVTDAKIGSRTITDTVAPTSDSAVLTTLLSNIGNIIKGITGKASWRTAPAITLEATNTHVNDTNNPHSVTATQVGALVNTLGVTSARMGTLAARPTASSAGNGAIYFSTDDLIIYRSNGTTWSMVATGSWNSLANKPDVPAVTWSGMRANSITALPTIIGDTFDFVAGSGISLSMNTNGTLTITNTSGSSGAIDNTGASKLVGASGSTTVTTTYADIVSYTGLPAGTYLFWTTLIGQIDVTGNSIIVLGNAGGSDVIPTAGYATGVDPNLGFTVTHFWLSTVGASSTLKVRAKKAAATGSMSITNNWSTFGYVRIA